ncbi:MAG TPA: SMI1/KNR4 family protein [Gemmatimonadaceae bacterium]|nr:SMI1/KNR4 family protein [Gemmatimonadaceae bacterium]
MSLEILIRDSGPEWTREEPASEEAVALLAAELPQLPPDYLAFLKLSNGGEGELGVEPGWFALWRAEEVAEMNAEYQVPEFLPGFVGFGSNGGGEMLAFGATPERLGRVYAVPFIPMEAEEALELAPDFATLVRAFGHRAPAA